jgi:hypothetical protein
MLPTHTLVFSLVASLSARDAVSVAQKWSPVVTVVNGSPTLGASDVSRYTQFIISAHNSETHGVMHYEDSSLSVFLVTQTKEEEVSFVASLTTCNSCKRFQDIVCEVVLWYHIHSGCLVSVDDENMI